MEFVVCSVYCILNRASFTAVSSAVKILDIVGKLVENDSFEVRKTAAHLAIVLLVGSPSIGQWSAALADWLGLYWWCSYRRPWNGSSTSSTQKITQYHCYCRSINNTNSNTFNDSCPRPLAGALSNDAVWRLSVWRLSRTSGLGQEQRGLERLKLPQTRTPLSGSKRQRSRSRGHLVLRRKMCHIFVADKATLYKFRTLTDCGQFLFTDCKLPPKWARRG